jgi:hypothetical protein
MLDRAETFIIEIMDLMPAGSVFSCYADYDELLPDLEATGYYISETGEAKIPLDDKACLLTLINQKNLLYRTDHFKIWNSQYPLLESYDKILFAWFSNTIQVSQEFIDRYHLTLKGESWEFLRDEPGSPKTSWILLLE